MPCSYLWINGIPGCGKTVLCSTIIDDLQALVGLQSRSIISYFYFSFADVKRQKCTSLLSSILAQLCPRPTIPQILQDLYEQHRHTRPTVDEPSKTLRSILNELDNVYIVIDALDECASETEGGEQEEILEWLSEMSCSKIDSLHTIVPSRREPNIQRSFSSKSVWHSVSFTKTSNTDDIASFIKNQLETNTRLKSLDESTEHDVETTLLRGADGM